MANFNKGNVKPLFRKPPPLSLKLAVFLLLSLGLMFAQKRTDAFHGVHAAVNASIQPIQFLAGLPEKLSGMDDYFTSKHQLIKENRHLQRRQLALQAQIEKLASLKAENEHIRKLLQSSRQINEQVSIAQIISAGPAPYRQYIMLNKGSNDGVYKGQALVDSYGIMGQVIRADPFTSTAVIITNANTGIPVSLARTGLQTVAEGSGKGFALRLPYLAENTDVRPGDLLISSGLGGRYPAGYPVATVTRVEHKPGSHFLSVQARPTAHLHREKQVLLVWNHKIASSQSAHLSDKQRLASYLPLTGQP